MIRATGSERSSHPTSFKVGDLEIFVVRRIATWRGEVLRLRPAQFRVLHHLAVRAGETVSRAELVSATFVRPSAKSERTLDVHMAAIRSRLGEGGPQIRTDHGRGYRLLLPAAVRPLPLAQRGEFPDDARPIAREPVAAFPLLLGGLARTLANPARVAILRAVCRHDMTSAMIADDVAQSAGAVKLHLRKLVFARLLRHYRCGREIFYSVERQNVVGLCTGLDALDREIPEFRQILRERREPSTPQEATDEGAAQPTISSVDHYD